MQTYTEHHTWANEAIKRGYHIINDLRGDLLVASAAYKGKELKGNFNFTRPTAQKGWLNEQDEA